MIAEAVGLRPGGFPTTYIVSYLEVGKAIPMVSCGFSHSWPSPATRVSTPNSDASAARVFSPRSEALAARVSSPRVPAARVSSPLLSPSVITSQPTGLVSSTLPATIPVTPTTESASSEPLTSEILIGKVPLKPCSDFNTSVDKIAVVFHNSSRKTLNYVPPSMQNGEVLVRSTLDMIRKGSRQWHTTAVDYFLGKKPYFHHLNDYVCSIWSAISDVTATSNGFVFFQFKMVVAMKEVIEDGPWLFQGQPIVLQKWEPGMVLRKLKHTEVLVWIKLRHLSVEPWTTDGLSTVASGIDRPLYPNAITQACTRLDFARVCVMLNVNSKLPKHIVGMVPKENGSESACMVDVEYEWLPPKCTGCTSLGHATKACPLNKPVKPPILKVRQGVLTYAAPQMLTHVECSYLECTGPEQERSSGRRKGPHCRIQWFVDYSGPGNRIWIAWDDEFIDVEIIGLTTQFMHCRILIRGLYEHLFITIVYGANDVVAQHWTYSPPYARGHFTWHNCSTDGRSLWKRLDRMFVNNSWMERWPNVFYNNLTPCTSDHSPLVMRGDRRNMQHPVVGTPMYSVTWKLKALKPVFRQQQRNKGDLEQNVKLAAGFLEIAQKLLQDDRHNPLLLAAVETGQRYLAHVNTKVSWIREVLDLLVSPTQNAFVPRARGLRQGDPMSPYLFVLVMEVLHLILQQFIEQDGGFLYHWRCQELKLFQLCFADDLLLLCKADERSLSLFRRALDLFASLSGLHANPHKSQLIISNAANGLRDKLLESLGRVQLIKSVLVALEVYWAMAFILPKGIIKEVVKRLRTFLWKGTSRSGYPKVLWDVVCKHVEECGQVKENKGAWGSRKMLALRHTLLPNIQFNTGDGNSSLWHDPWHSLGPLILRFPRGP
ncbi:UNVERIFIED_CONTAM: hypothetical protein Scaly_2680300 [Sesamum calycinum]|uniref:Reverse transcriptase domain-containing protein n=1 Tax=Sesamum calycinum TaxID=2727403 RepID=A0AAW2J6K3_9LAMI